MFDSGVLVIQSNSLNEEAIVEEIVKKVNLLTCMLLSFVVTIKLEKGIIPSICCTPAFYL